MYNTKNVLQFVITSGLFINIVQFLMKSITNNIIYPLFEKNIINFKSKYTMEIFGINIKIGDILIDLLSIFILIFTLFFIIRYIT